MLSFNLDHVRQLSTQFGATVKFVIVLESGTVKEEQEVFKGLKLRATPYFDSDGKLARALGVYATPQAVLTDSHERIVYRGNYNVSRYCVDTRTEFVRMALECVTAGQPLPALVKSSIPAYGCAIPTLMDSKTRANPKVIASPADANFGFSSAEVHDILEEQYGRIDLLMERFLIVHSAIAFALAFVYSTWLITVPVAVSALLMFAISRRFMPRTLFTRSIAGIALQAFVALHIYQLHGLPEMHFFFFTAQTMMILYYDARAFWPGTLLIIVQHILFSALTNAGYQLYFFPDSYVTVTKQFFHYSIAVGQVGVCAYWAHNLRLGLLRDTRQRHDLLESNAALNEARSAAERANSIKSQF